MLQQEITANAIDDVCDIVLAYDANGTICYENGTARRNLEYPQGQAYQITDVFPGTFSVKQGMVLVNAEPTDEEYLVDIYRANRTCFPVRLRLNRLSDGMTLCVVHDRTKELYLLHKIEVVGQEAQAAAKAKSEFVANITHELRTPVNGILGNTLSLKEIEQSADHLKKIQLIERGCADMNAIINNILDFSKLDAGKFTIENRAFDFRAMMDYVRSNHRDKILEKGLQFSMSVAPEIPERIIGDELRIVQVLNNLISNAYKFTSVGSIAVEVVKTSQLGNRMELFFLVIDTGIGISRQNQDKLFLSFSQVDASISRKYGGTGLGLNICKQLVELMDGSIHVESEEGQGSMFSFQIWVEVPSDELCEGADATEPTLTAEEFAAKRLQELTGGQEGNRVRTFGTDENAEELKRNLSKLILSVEMDNWEKAEEFSAILRELTMDAPQEAKSAVLRLKMAVQKQDYDVVSERYHALCDALGVAPEG